jgi:hypothetical protein
MMQQQSGMNFFFGPETGRSLTTIIFTQSKSSERFLSRSSNSFDVEKCSRGKSSVMGVPLCCEGLCDDLILPPNVRDHRAGPDDPSKAEPSDAAGSGASSCWADAQSAGETL